MILTAEFLEPANRKVPTHCTVEGCDNYTREAKPWCSDHVRGFSPYVLEQAEELEARRVEVITGKVRLDGTLVQDVLRFAMDSHAPTLRRLSREVAEFEGQKARRYVDRLVRLGLVKIVRTMRSDTRVLALTESGRELLG